MCEGASVCASLCVRVVQNCGGRCVLRPSLVTEVCSVLVLAAGVRCCCFGEGVSVEHQLTVRRTRLTFQKKKIA